MPDSKRLLASDFGYDIAISCVLACISAYTIYAVRFGIPDDAFIYSRIAENFASGNGWSFNPGVMTNAATSPLFVILLATLNRIGLTGAAALLAAYWAGLTSLVSILYWQLRRAGRFAAALAAIAIILLSTILKPVGMETTVFLASIAFVCVAYEREWKFLLGLSLGIAILGRPDGIIMLPIIAGFEFFTKRSVPWKVMVSCFLVIAPWLLFSLFEFHGLVPHTATIKSVQGHLAARHSLEGWASAFIAQLPLPFLLVPCFITGAIILIAGLKSRPPFATLLVCFGIAQVIFYTILAAPAGYPWYYVPGNLSYLIAAFIGAQYFSHQAQKWATSIRLRNIQTASERFRNLDGRALGLALSIACLFGLMLFDTHWRAHKHYRESENYIDAAKWLQAHGSRKDWLAADEIGYIGYFSGLNVKDMLGLLDQYSVPYIKDEQWDWWYTEQTVRPRFAMLHEPNWIGEPNARYGAWPTEKKQEFFGDYTKVQSFGDVVIYELVENARASDAAAPLSANK